MKILSVCRANVGRSQVLAALLRKMYPQHIVLSAGTKVVGNDGLSRHGVSVKDTKNAYNMVTLLEEEGVDPSTAIRTQLSPEMLEGMDRIIVMAEPEHIPEYLAKHPKMIYWEMPDLKEQSMEFHREVRDRIKRLVEENANLFQ